MSSFCAVSWAVDPGACVIEMSWQEPHSRPGLISWLRMLLSAVWLLLTTVRREDGHDTQRSRTALRDGRRDRNLKGRSRDLRRSIAYRADECMQSMIAAKMSVQNNPQKKACSISCVMFMTPRRYISSRGTFRAWVMPSWDSREEMSR